MANKYSPSKIGTFDGCKLQYKYIYVDGLKSELETIEAFLGTTVHSVLESFYKLVKGGKIESLDWVLKEYEDVWNKNYHKDIKVIKKEFTAQDYFERGKDYLIDYYNTYKPFDITKIVELEHLLNFYVKDNDNEYYLNGFIDRLDWNDKDKIFEIHDYKTTGRLMTQEEADTSLQLGIYHFGIKNKWPDIKNIKLIWHMLAFNREVVSERTDEDLVILKNTVTQKIQEIESCKEFPPTKSALCSWCGFKNICPVWKHTEELRELPENEYKKDPGVKLVKAYKELEDEKVNLENEIKKIKIEQDKISEAAIEFAKKNDISIIDGEEARLKVDIKEELKPLTKAEDEEKWLKLREFLIQEDKFKDVSTVNANMLTYQIKKWPVELVNKVSKYLVNKVTESVRLIKKD